MLHTGKDHSLLILTERASEKDFCRMYSLVPCSHLSLAQTLGTVPPTASPSSEVDSHSLSYRAWGFQAPFSVKPLSFSSFPPRFALPWCSLSLPFCGLPHLLPTWGISTCYVTWFHVYSLIKRDFIAHAVDLDSMTGWFHRWCWCLFRGFEIIVRTTSMACLWGDGSKDKKKCVVSRGRHALQYLFFQNANTAVTFCALAGLERAVLGFLSTCSSSVCSPGREKCI